MRGVSCILMMATTDTSAATTATQEDFMKLTNDYQFTDADIVIRASGVDFFVHKFTLANASPVFKDMLSLPSDGPSQKGADGCDIAIIALDEDALTFHRVLCLYYPHAQDPRDLDLRSLHSSLLALRKDDMEKGRIRMARELLAHAISASIQAFAVA
ncbi:unnamed protein product [Somion occarium]|uniref:BTB domain-containing protein n=1 Tax=Somion occarium TaxID=3059160 RepID=A0ABP1DIA7_9APHY